MHSTSMWSPSLDIDSADGASVQHYVDVYSATGNQLPDWHYVVITDGQSLLEELEQPSLWSSWAECAGRIRAWLGLPRQQCSFIAAQAGDEEGGDPQYRLMRWGEHPSLEPLALVTALALQDQGLSLTQWLGHVGVFESADRVRRVPIGGFDGARYYDLSGVVIPGRLIRVDESQPWRLTSDGLVS